MVLTFRSTGTTEVILIQQESDGARRVARATQDPANPRQWKTQLEHPTGVRPCSPVYGTTGDASIALSHYLHETQTDWARERARGHRPEPKMRDTSQRVDEAGNLVGATITKRY